MSPMRTRHITWWERDAELAGVEIERAILVGDGGDDPSHFGDVRCAGGKGKKPTRSSRKLRAMALARGDRPNTWVEEQHRCARPPRGRARRWPRARASGSFGGVELRAALGAMERVPTQLGRFASVAEHSGTCSPNVGERRHQS